MMIFDIDEITTVQIRKNEISCDNLDTDILVKIRTIYIVQHYLFVVLQNKKIKTVITVSKISKILNLGTCKMF